MANKQGNECLLCASSVATEIVEAKKLGVKTPKLLKKFQAATGYKGNTQAFYMILYRHIQSGHAITSPQKTPIPEGGYTLEEYTDKLMGAVMSNPDMFEGKKVSHQAVIAAQRAVIEKEKVKVQNDAMKLAIIAFARGQGMKLPEGVVIEGDELIEANTQ